MVSYETDVTTNQSTSVRMIAGRGLTFIHVPKCINFQSKDKKRIEQR